MLGLDLRTHQILRFLMLWIAGAVVFALCIGLPIANLNARTFYKLSHHGVVTQGIVTGLEPPNHRTVHYKYEVGGQTYFAADQGGGGPGNPAFENLTIGENVQVYYVPGQASISCLGNPHELVANELIPLALGAVIFPLLVIGGNAAKYARFRNWLLAR